MKESKLAVLAMDFAVEIIGFCRENKQKNILINQLLRSGTSIGANIHEANYAQSKPDFISKLKIALKECYETEYWLELFKRTDIISNETASTLNKKCGTIRRIIISSVNTAEGK